MKIKISIDKAYDLDLDFIRQYDIDVVDFIDRSIYGNSPVTLIQDDQDENIGLIIDTFYTYFSKWCEQGYQIIYFCDESEQSTLYRGASIASGYFEDIYIVCLPLNKTAIQNLLECLNDMIEKNVSLNQIWQVCSDFSNSN